ncbi:MAG: RNA-binding protein [Acidobacteriota bacterium]
MKMFVGNLPYRATETELRDLFEAFGEVQSARIILNRDTGQSRGFGFVEMDDQDAEEAMAQLNGGDFQGRRLVVNEARPRTDQGGGGGGYGGGGGRGGYGGGGGGGNYGGGGGGGNYGGGGGGGNYGGGGGGRW